MASLNIEQEEYGDAMLEPAEFRVADGRGLVIMASGDFWTDHVYKHPTTSEAIFPDEDEVAAYEEATNTELEILRSTVDYVLKFDGRIDRK